ncbi:MULTISPECIES: BrnT family toxin [Alkalimonas]|uniref:BrnT family toxin n=1 Tax=Alkalimonas mucilaginosa TaxID=3057676 RepID=A0ABU7JD48_9GAMM|nr:BrnT family toxin [Alkalimonas sp. MEB004]MEE2023574.1 BrnT family toxin [Alkalimonas sp. MEB004]
MRISYDPAKNQRNIQERQLSFDDAVHLDWATARIWQDTRKVYPEVRYIAVGYLAARLHVLCFAETADGIRVISFRKANQREQRAYETTDR